MLHPLVHVICDLIKILVINHKRLWYISINLDDVILKLYTKFVPKSKMYSLCWEHYSSGRIKVT